MRQAEDAIIAVVAASRREAEVGARNARLGDTGWRAVMRVRDTLGCHFAAIVWVVGWDRGRDGFALKAAVEARTWPNRRRDEHVNLLPT